MPAVVSTHIWTSPVGDLILASIGDALCMCDWASRAHHGKIEKRICRGFDAEMCYISSPVINEAISQLELYFSGALRVFTIPVRLAGTDFQKRVWMALTKIPYGSVVSYRALAENIGKGSAVRAVASAIGANPISIIVPCHRVIGSTGTLTGYAGGLPAKSFLLHLEHSLQLKQ